MIGRVESALLSFARKRNGKSPRNGPLLVELLQSSDSELVESYPNGLFRCEIRREENGAASKTTLYETVPVIGMENLSLLRGTVGRISERLVPDQVKPLSFTRLVEVLGQMAAHELSTIRDLGLVKELSRLAAFEAVGLPTIFALSRDRNVQEFFLDSPNSPVYLDHAKYGRCDTRTRLEAQQPRGPEVAHQRHAAHASNPALRRAGRGLRRDGLRAHQDPDRAYGDAPVRRTGDQPEPPGFHQVNPRVKCYDRTPYRKSGATEAAC